VRLRVSYDGAPFRGWARNHGVPSVEAPLVEAISTVLRHPVTLAVAGRTDAGVHARQQMVSFDADAERLDVQRLVGSVNQLVAPSIAVRDARIASDGFDARFSCTGRRYRYHIHNAPEPDPLRAAMSWHVRDRLDLRAMRAASDQLIGTHDFSSFCRRPKTKPDQSLVRRVRSARWSHVADEPDLVRLEIAGRAFCHQMVRSIVGTVVEVGRGRRTAASVGEILRARDRTAAASPAPAHGLVLWDTEFAPDAVADAPNHP